jgi:hypothetical protein
MSDKDEIVVGFISKLKELIDNIDNICNDNQIHKVAGLTRIFLDKTPYEAVETIGSKLIEEPIQGYILKGVSNDSILVIKKLICSSVELKEYVDVNAVANTLEIKWKSLNDAEKRQLMTKARKLLRFYALYKI